MKSDCRLVPHAKQVLELLQSRLYDLAQWLVARQRRWVEWHVAIDSDLDMGGEQAETDPPPLYDDALWEGGDAENDEGAAAPAGRVA